MNIALPAGVPVSIPLLMQIQINALGTKLAEEHDQILQRAAEPIDGPCGHLIELAPGHSPEQAIVSWPAVAPLVPLTPRVNELGDNLPAVPLGDG